MDCVHNVNLKTSFPIANGPVVECGLSRGDPAYKVELLFPVF